MLTVAGGIILAFAIMYILGAISYGVLWVVTNDAAIVVVVFGAVFTILGALAGWHFDNDVVFTICATLALPLTTLTLIIGAFAE